MKKILFITLIIGAFRGIIGVIRHFTVKENEVIENVNSDIPENLPDENNSSDNYDFDDLHRIISTDDNFLDKMRSLYASDIHSVENLVGTELDDSS